MVRVLNHMVNRDITHTCGASLCVEKVIGDDSLSSRERQFQTLPKNARLLAGREATFGAQPVQVLQGENRPGRDVIPCHGGAAERLDCLPLGWRERLDPASQQLFGLPNARDQGGHFRRIRR